jgi:ArsR family transcriptional regulator
MSALLTALRAAAEISRLRIIAILSKSELTVSEIVEILNQSQPRVSRHLKVLCDSGLLQRYQEGSWVFHRLNDTGAMASITQGICRMINLADPEFSQDQERLGKIKDRNASQAAEYFSKNATDWDSIRQMGVSDTDIEKKLIESLNIENPELFVDLGTGTGRMLQIFSPFVKKGVGIDINREMLLVARSNLDSAGVANCTVRQNNMSQLPFDHDTVDVIIIHQVLHYIDNPEYTIVESSRALKPGGQLIIVDFLPHDLEFLRDNHAHRRLGFSDATIKEWAQSNNLELTAAEHLHPRNPDTQSLSVGLWNLKK